MLISNTGQFQGCSVVSSCKIFAFYICIAAFSLSLAWLGKKNSKRTAPHSPPPLSQKNYLAKKTNIIWNFLRFTWYSKILNPHWDCTISVLIAVALQTRVPQGKGPKFDPGPLKPIHRMNNSMSANMLPMMMLNSLKSPWMTPWLARRITRFISLSYSAPASPTVTQEGKHSVEVTVNDPVVGQAHHQVHQLVLQRPPVTNCNHMSVNKTALKSLWMTPWLARRITRLISLSYSTPASPTVTHECKQ